MHVMQPKNNKQICKVISRNFTGLFSRTTWVSQYQEEKAVLNFNEERDYMVFWDGSGISQTICEQSAPCSSLITMPTPHRSIFTGQMLIHHQSRQYICNKVITKNQTIP